MNYIREELLRQQRALAALMSGEEPDLAEERGEGLADLAREEREELRGHGDTAGYGGRPLSRSVSRAAEGVPFFEPAAFENGEPAVPWAVAGTRARPETAGMAAGRWSVSEALAAGTAMDLRSVSRGIQRDARRYDGGFSMY